MNFYAAILPAVVGAAPVSWLGGSTSFAIVEASATANYVGYAEAGIKQLQTWYNTTSGLYSTAWWNTANALQMLADFQEYSPTSVSSITATVFPNTLANAPRATGFTGFLNEYYDDELWYALAFIKYYQVTGLQEYLDMASQIFEDSKSVWGTATCGGLWWDKKHTQVNAVANALYMVVAVKLANIKPHTPSENYYLYEATKAHAWFMASGLINAQNLVNDGLDLSTCKNNNGTTFTYNQGIILSALVELTWATGDASYATQANTMALATISALTDSSGILHEACEPSACDANLQQFKGIFMRNVQFMYQRSTVMPADTKAKLKTFLTTNANSIWVYDNSGGNLGLVWSGPYQTATLETQSSALDALVAAAAISISDEK